jgi:hypothetical protein
MAKVYDPEAEARKARKRAVRLARQNGGTVPFDLRTLIEDGWSLDTIRAVIRPA